MCTHSEWTIVFYIEDSGGNPVDDFLSRLDARAKAKFDWAIAQLRVRNITALEPLVKHLEWTASLRAKEVNLEKAYD
jgi:hypothetical protein